MFLFVAVAAFGLSAILTYFFGRPGSPLYVLDHPNERSLHSRPTPRTGGVAIVTAGYLASVAAVFCCVTPEAALAWVALAGLLVAGVSFAEDRIGLPRRYRLFAHFAAAALLVAAGLGLSELEPAVGLSVALPVGLSVPLTLCFVVWMINLYNFMDGMDGFAGGMAVFGFGAFGVLGWGAGHESFALLAWIVAAAAGGFLLFNFPPARIFMGDVGSTVLGFLASALMLWAERDGIFPLWIGLLVFSPFIVDATVTLVRRALRGERIWLAHKTHYYQRLVQLGWGHRRTVLWEYALMTGCAATALGVVGREPRIQGLALGAWAVIYALLMAAVSRLEDRARDRQGR